MLGRLGLRGHAVKGSLPTLQLGSYSGGGWAG